MNSNDVPAEPLPYLVVSPEAPAVAEEQIKANTVQYCLDIFYENINLVGCISTLLKLWTEYDDDEVDMRTNILGETVRPVRLCIIRTLLQHPNQEEMDFFMNTQDHPAIDVIRHAKEGLDLFKHSFVLETFQEAVSCCATAISSHTVYVCQCCKKVACEACVSPLCPAELGELLSVSISERQSIEERSEDESETEEDSEDASEDSDSEDSDSEDEETRLRRGAKFGPPEEEEEEEQQVQGELVDYDCMDENGVYNFTFVW